MGAGDDFFFTGGGFSDWSGGSAGRFGSSSSVSGYSGSKRPPYSTNEKGELVDENGVPIKLTWKDHVAAAGCLTVIIGILCAVGYMIYCNWEYLLIALGI